MEICKKIREIRGDESQADFAKRFGITSRTLQNYEYGNTSPSIDFIQKISDEYEIAPDYFFSQKKFPNQKTKSSSITKELVPQYNKNQFLIEKKSETESPNSDQTLNEKANLTLNDDFVKIPFYDDVVASAGQGYINTESPPQYITFSKAYLREFLGIYSVKNLSIITSNGDSMLPTIPQNCNIIVEHSAPKDGEICITRIGEDLLIKRLQKFPKIRLLSDNASYEPIDLEKQEYEIIGRVICYIKRV